MLSKCITTNIEVNGHTIDQSIIVKYLGAWLDQELKLKQHITNKCRLAMANIQGIKNLRLMLTKQAMEILVIGLVMSHLDYCNTLFIGLPECDISRLQQIQNICVRLVLHKEQYYSTTECLKTLHWLPICLRIKHKLITIVYKCLKGKAPTYLSNWLTLNPINRIGLRSSGEYKKLIIPRVKNKTFAARSFSVLGPTWWNQLPNEIKILDTLDVFKKHLKLIYLKNIIMHKVNPIPIPYQNKIVSVNKIIIYHYPKYYMCKHEQCS